jgi:hypothetical protein
LERGLEPPLARRRTGGLALAMAAAIGGMKPHLPDLLGKAKSRHREDRGNWTQRTPGLFFCVWLKLPL